MKDYISTDEKEINIEPLKDYPAYMPLSKVVFQSLKDSIVKGTLEPGQLLSENRIAAKLNVSRTPVREALRRLEQENMVKMLSGRRLIVSIPTVQDVEEIYDIRLLVETEALRRIAPDDAIIAQLENYIRTADNYLQNKDILGLSQVNTEFHAILISTLNNRRLEQYIDSLQDTIARFRAYSLNNTSWAEESEGEHSRIVECLKRGDSEGAVMILREHLIKGRNVLVSMISPE